MKTLRKNYVVDDKGRRQGVILSMKQFEEMVEDLHDLAIVAERRQEKTITLAQLKRNLKRDGLL
ncbi:MAG: hypothetical protein A2W23_09430 [Planctomycetes bacterium RBG_16_43_13]|nr:MAG: hypothetical protein A2W23_09430 [Planctomycetes bacterium RBG_16_43_13]